MIVRHDEKRCWGGCPRAARDIPAAPIIPSTCRRVKDAWLKDQPLYQSAASAKLLPPVRHQRTFLPPCLRVLCRGSTQTAQLPGENARLGGPRFGFKGSRPANARGGRGIRRLVRIRLLTAFASEGGNQRSPPRPEPAGQGGRASEGYWPIRYVRSPAVVILGCTTFTSPPAPAPPPLPSPSRSGV